MTADDGPRLADPNRDGNQETGRFAYRLVLFAIFAVIFAFIVVTLVFATLGQFETKVVTSVAPSAFFGILLAILGSGIGAYFVQSSQRRGDTEAIQTADEIAAAASAQADHERALALHLLAEKLPATDSVPELTAAPERIAVAPPLVPREDPTQAWVKE